MPQEKAKQLYQFLIYSVIFGLKKVPIVGAAVELAVDWQNNVKIQLNQQANLKVQERLAQIEQAMLCLPDEVRKMAQEMIAELRKSGVEISPEKEEAVVDLASAMPAAIRERTQATLRQARQHGTALHTVLPVGEQVSTQERAEFYQSLLPARRSAFRENDWLPHRNPPWQLVQLLGAGGFGEVWEARHPQLNDRFAVKFCQDEASAKVLKQEATALFRLRKELPEHPNIVRLWDLQLDKEPYWLAFEYVPGGTLEALMRGTSLTWQEVLAIFLPIVEGMSAVHKVGIVHRDLKPANILLTEAGVPKITDFGIGKVMEEQERTRLLLSRSLTMAGFGSAGYASPEQIKGLPAHPADDTYALGALLWQMVTHTLQPPQYVQRSLKGVQIPDVMKTLIIDCLENPREERPQRAEELLKVLQPLVSVRDKTARRKAEVEAKRVKIAERGEPRIRQIALTIKELSPFNPLDWWRLLVWVLWSPQHLKVHREIFGQDGEKYVSRWLFSTLIWLPLFLPTLGVALEWLPLSSLRLEWLPHDPKMLILEVFHGFHINSENVIETLDGVELCWGVKFYWVSVSVIGIIWLLFGMFGECIFVGIMDTLVLIIIVIVVGTVVGTIGGELSESIVTPFVSMTWVMMLEVVGVVGIIAVGLTSGFTSGIESIAVGVAIVVGVAIGLAIENTRSNVVSVGTRSADCDGIFQPVYGLFAIFGFILLMSRPAGFITLFMPLLLVMALEDRLKTGESSIDDRIDLIIAQIELIVARIVLIALLLSHAFIFWYSLLGGWRFFA